MKNLEKNILLPAVLLGTACLAGPVIRETMMMIGSIALALTVTERSLPRQPVRARAVAPGRANRPPA